MPTPRRLLGWMTVALLAFSGAEPRAEERMSLLEGLDWMREHRDETAKKIGQYLYIEWLQWKGEEVFPGVGSYRFPTHVQISESGDAGIMILIRDSVVHRELALRRLAELGGTLRGRAFPFKGPPPAWIVSATLPIANVYELAAHPSIKGVYESLPETQITFDARAETTEGDVNHRSAVARSTRAAIDGRNASDGITNVSRLMASNDLPERLAVLPCFEGERSLGRGTEGSALLEIIHDIAPNARLGFISVLLNAPFDSVMPPDHVAEIIRCAASRRPPIIVDDVAQLYFETPFEPGPIAKAIQDYINAGGVYVTTSGNRGNADNPTDPRGRAR